MKKTKILKIIIAILIAITVFVAFAQNASALTIDLNQFDNETDKSNVTRTSADILGKAINILQVFGAGFAIIMLVVIGIRWMGASPSGKAQYAKTSRYYIIGAVFIFAAIGLLQIVKTFTKQSIVGQIS